MKINHIDIIFPAMKVVLLNQRIGNGPEAVINRHHLNSKKIDNMKRK